MKKSKESPGSGVHSTIRRGSAVSKSRAIFEEEQKLHFARLPGYCALFADCSGPWPQRDRDRRGWKALHRLCLGNWRGKRRSLSSALRAALKKQIGAVSPTGSFTTEVRMKFLRLLASLLPKPLRRIQLFSGGAEAVEAAFRLAKSVTKKFEFVGFWGGFHGKTGGVLGLLGDEFKKDLGPFMPGSLPLSLCVLLPMSAQAALPLLRPGLRRALAPGDQIAEPATSGRDHSGADPRHGWETSCRRRNFCRLFNRSPGSSARFSNFGRNADRLWARPARCGDSSMISLSPDVLTVGKGIGGGFPLSGVISTR